MLRSFEASQLRKTGGVVLVDRWASHERSRFASLDGDHVCVTSLLRVRVYVWMFWVRYGWCEESLGWWYVVVENRGEAVRGGRAFATTDTTSRVQLGEDKEARLQPCYGPLRPSSPPCMQGCDCPCTCMFVLGEGGDLPSNKPAQGLSMVWI